MNKRNIVMGIVVLYNPLIEEVKKNIRTYIEELDLLICIDNSNCDNGMNFNNEKIVYLPQNKNIGLSKALILGCEYAISNGADILVTLDQDTFFEKKSLAKLIDRVVKDKNTVFVPNIKRITRDKFFRRIAENVPIYICKDMEVPWAITSGTTFSVDLYKKVGGFDEKLFIGQIDQDFCTAVYSSYNKIIRIGDSYIYQELGNATIHKIIFKTVYAPNLNAMRYYYVFRNERYLRKKWGVKYKRNRVSLYKYILVVVMFEKNKYSKIMAMLRGYNDGKKLLST